MRSQAPILDLEVIVGRQQGDNAVGMPLSLRLLSGECALIETAEEVQLAFFADLCSGLIQPQSGHVRFLGHDWRNIPDEYAAALRGRIGRVFTAGAWIPFLDVETNILLPALYHTRRDRQDLRNEALSLAHEFGLPGLPLDRPGDLSPGDLHCASLVRAFLGNPLLVLVEDPSNLSLRRRFSAVLTRMATVLESGGAVVWFSRDRTIGDAMPFPADHHLELSDRGLALKAV
jgi:phospholipid/cholesterol/gamma-HCH transport system ATP-binding protein